MGNPSVLEELRPEALRGLLGRNPFLVPSEAKRADLQEKIVVIGFNAETAVGRVWRCVLGKGVIDIAKGEIAAT